MGQIFLRCHISTQFLSMFGAGFSGVFYSFDRFLQLSPNNAIYDFGDVAFVDTTPAEWGSKRKRERKEKSLSFGP